MSYSSETMTPADIAAVCGDRNDNGMFGGDFLAYIILFALLGGGIGGFGGFGGGNILPWLLFGNGGFGGNCATQADLAAGFNNSAVLSNLDSIENSLCQGFNGVNTAILQSGYQTQAGINTLSHQISDCCCATQRAIDRVAYENATNTCAIQNTIQSTTRDIIENANANSRAVLDFLVQSKLADKDARIATLEGQVTRAEQNAYIGATVNAGVAEIIRRTGSDCPVPAYVVSAPTPINFPTNYCGQVQFGGNSGCGCN